MRWQGGRRGGGVEDRRGLGGGAIATGGGLGVIVISLIGYFVFGIDPFTTQQIASQFGGAGTQLQGAVGTPEDQAGLVVDVVGANIDDVWTTRLDGYTSPKTVIYTQGTSTGCGFGQAAMGPFYCPNDQTVYLDLAFWQDMETQLGASGADFARAYVIAHEFGHHVQTLEVQRVLDLGDQQFGRRGDAVPRQFVIERQVRLPHRGQARARTQAVVVQQLQAMLHQLLHQRGHAGCALCLPAQCIAGNCSGI